jgi:tetratricopeptide (TPR) repeat protein
MEAIGWGRTAVSLRPNNPLAHYYHAAALYGYDGPDAAKAVDELHRTIELAPKFSRAHGRLAFVLRINSKRDNVTKRAEALDAAREAIKLDEQNLLGRYVIFDYLLREKDYIEAAQVYRRLRELFAINSNNEPSEGPVEAYMKGRVIGSLPSLLRGLIADEKPFEAYRLIPGVDPQRISILRENGGPGASRYYLAACAAALAGTGQGSDAPPSKDRPAIRKHALEWLTSSFDIWNKHAAALPVLGASTVGLMSSPFGHGPVLLGAFALSSGSPHPAAELAKNREVVHKGMNHWLSDPNLAGVRDDQWLDKLPANEREKWRKLWSEVRSLRDRTAPAKAAQPVRKK